MIASTQQENKLSPAQMCAYRVVVKIETRHKVVLYSDFSERVEELENELELIFWKEIEIEQIGTLNMNQLLAPYSKEQNAILNAETSAPLEILTRIIDGARRNNASQIQLKNCFSNYAISIQCKAGWSEFQPCEQATFQALFELTLSPKDTMISIDSENLIVELRTVELVQGVIIFASWRQAPFTEKIPSFFSLSNLNIKQSKLVLCAGNAIHQHVDMLKAIELINGGLQNVYSCSSCIESLPAKDDINWIHVDKLSGMCEVLLHCGIECLVVDFSVFLDKVWVIDRMLQNGICVLLSLTVDSIEQIMRKLSDVSIPLHLTKAYLDKIIVCWKLDAKDVTKHFNICIPYEYQDYPAAHYFQSIQNKLIQAELSVEI